MMITENLHPPVADPRIAALFSRASEFADSAKVAIAAGLNAGKLIIATGLTIAALAACTDAAPGGQVFEGCDATFPTGATLRQSPATTSDNHDKRILDEGFTTVNPILAYGFDGAQPEIAARVPGKNAWTTDVVIKCADGSTIRLDFQNREVKRERPLPSPAPLP